MMKQVVATPMQLSYLTGGISNKHRCCREKPILFATIEHIEPSMYQFIFRLDPPYVQDSLPMALRHTVESWNSTLQLVASVPKSWVPEPIVQKRLLINFLETLCACLSNAAVMPQKSEIILKQQKNLNELNFSATYCDALPSGLVERIKVKLIPILQSIQLLAQGHDVIDSGPCHLRWILQWPNQKLLTKRRCDTDFLNQP